MPRNFIPERVLAATGAMARVNIDDGDIFIGPASGRSRRVRPGGSKRGIFNCHSDFTLIGGTLAVTAMAAEAGGRSRTRLEKEAIRSAQTTSRTRDPMRWPLWIPPDGGAYLSIDKLRN